MIRLLFSFIFVLNACAWNKESFKKSNQKNELIDEFDIKQEDQEKFRVGPSLSTPQHSVTKKPTPKTKTKPDLITTGTKKSIVKKQQPIKDKKKIIPKKNISKKKSKTKKKSAPAAKFKKYDDKSKLIWAEFKPKIFYNEKMEIDIRYFGVTAGKVILHTLEDNKEVNGRPTFHFQVILKSAPFYSYIYRLDDLLNVYVDMDDFKPIKYSLVQDESKQQVQDLQLFDHEKNLTQFWYKRLKEGKEKKEYKKMETPEYMLDSLSPLFFFRGLDLSIGKKYEFPIITRAKMWVLKAEVAAHEKIRIGKKTYDAIKMKAETRYPGVLKKRGDINFWYSNDDKRKILKFEAKIKIGTVEGVLTDYEPGRRYEVN